MIEAWQPFTRVPAGELTAFSARFTLQDGERRPEQEARRRESFDVEWVCAAANVFATERRSNRPLSATNTPAVSRASWLPMIVIALAQIQLGFNVNALTISMGAIVDDFDTSATTVGTALVVYSLAVAGLVMLGARVGELIGSRLAFQVGIAAQGAAMVGDGAEHRPGR